ncbi:hypothetical protein [Natrialba asiatica]|uniref:Uncharacterized protein n=1 Tax=Natrialba asiatica (strain ATCC 700177 / DSM 12278 / JCM 9576 / FERM P-10747 / NBRC 102637 / 172P1) TaxID=29540 RepID=M0AHS2_NATA1|nr:hypothetical protein [Natrialba asiatica]ELY97921.1 hypothetical protein C481_18335 [Natrialba asiatica DSM 12278]
MSNSGHHSISRRSVVRSGSLLLGALVSESIGTTRVSAQSGSRSGSESESESEAESEPQPDFQARLYGNDFYPAARFRVVSSSLEYKPAVSVQEGETFLGDLYWSDYDTRLIRYENTQERVLFFPPFEADLDQETTYRTDRIQSTDELADGIVRIGFHRDSSSTA